MAAAPHVNNLRIAIAEDVLRDLYVTQGLTLEKVAARIGVAPTTISRRLRDLGIRARGRGPVPGSWRDEPRGLVAPRAGVWTPELAYVVGLIATDGNLSRQRWGLAVSSKDVDLLDTVRRCLHLKNSITPYSHGRCYHLQWRDRHFYQWLVGLGLTPAKSLTLGPLAVPDEYFADFFRGCIDGDGTVLVYTDRYHTAKKQEYVYERLYVSLVSGSQPFVDWMRTKVRALLGVQGEINERRKDGHRSHWQLRYAKAESIRLIGWMYYERDVPCLARKRAKAERFLSPLGYSPFRRAGRPRIGWLYNRATTQTAGVE